MVKHPTSRPAANFANEMKGYLKANARMKETSVAIRPMSSKLRRHNANSPNSASFQTNNCMHPIKLRTLSIF